MVVPKTAIRCPFLGPEPPPPTLPCLHPPSLPPSLLQGGTVTVNPKDDGTLFSCAKLSPTQYPPADPWPACAPLPRPFPRLLSPGRHGHCQPRGRRPGQRPATAAVVQRLLHGDGRGRGAGVVRAAVVPYGPAGGRTMGKGSGAAPSAWGRVVRHATERPTRAVGPRGLRTGLLAKAACRLVWELQGTRRWRLKAHRATPHVWRTGVRGLGGRTTDEVCRSTRSMMRRLKDKPSPTHYQTAADEYGTGVRGLN